MHSYVCIYILWLHNPCIDLYNVSLYTYLGVPCINLYIVFLYTYLSVKIYTLFVYTYLNLLTVNLYNVSFCISSRCSKYQYVRFLFSTM